jgi:hypothetical protein
MHFNQKQIQRIVVIMKSLYFIVFATAAIGLFFFFVFDFDRLMEEISVTISIIFSGLVALVVFIGLHRKKSWIIPTVIGKWIGLALSLFELYFFTRKKVKEYFGSKGIFVFS